MFGSGAKQSVGCPVFSWGLCGHLEQSLRWTCLETALSSGISDVLRGT